MCARHSSTTLKGISGFLLKDLMKLVLSQEITKENYDDYIDEWKKSKEVLIPSTLNQSYGDFCAFTKKEQSLDLKDAISGRVPNETYFLVEANGYIIGAVNLRYEMTEVLLKKGGHISLGIRPSMRNKGYAFIMLKLAFNIMRPKGMTKILMTCVRGNKSCQGTMKKVGAKLENSYEIDDYVIDRYWVNL